MIVRPDSRSPLAPLPLEVIRRRVLRPNPNPNRQARGPITPDHPQAYALYHGEPQPTPAAAAPARVRQCTQCPQTFLPLDELDPRTECSLRCKRRAYSRAYRKGRS